MNLNRNEIVFFFLFEVFVGVEDSAFIPGFVVAVIGIDRLPSLTEFDIAEESGKTGDLFKAKDFILFHAEML